MIIGKNIYLRSIEESDWILIKKWNFDAETAAFFSPRLPISDIEQRKWFDSQINQKDKKKLIIVEKESNMSIGMIGLMNIDHINKNVEIGITMGEKQFAGKGLAKDAMVSAIRFMFEQQNMHQVYLTTLQNNHSAIKLFESVGFKNIAILPERVFCNNEYTGMLYMSIKKSDFRL